MAVMKTMKDNDTTSSAGKLAEELAARFLEKRGLHVVARNFRCRGGEIDLVCRDGKVLVFVEVRLRRNAGFGGAGEYYIGQAAAHHSCRTTLSGGSRKSRLGLPL